ncbi:mannose-1-phosphate guanylyltransferase [Aureibaculum sp. 2210JD6-5]|uniref:mannose-1-phosphate guanylyltransferase n=1 Tax=Aureibaculum sp. 2210JD6-5 TaxID=3103957 RepID=UPI002AAD97F8|nr:mannose-1-phosphate guanylyltransferase [Aureibaculum sp. 2210JD6-5]MDY7395394.1 mannose-1-phosphate guanylyltransferase [Aureibaculum sp. 2210JD6-5]
MKKNNYYAVIMAGGVGSRFWPVSTSKFPKQFHDMLGKGDSLLQRTFKRLSALIPKENILIATNANYKNLVLEQLPECSDKQLLLEPAMRNTAPCILYAALKIQQKDPNAVMVVAPSDHWIDNEQEFINNIQTAFNACEDTDILMTLGIQPNNPNTGYGYIKFENDDADIKKVINFTEKPDLETATKFLESGNYVWNAGIFIWSVKSIIKAFENYLPEMNRLFCQGAQTYNTKLESDFIAENYQKAENISIDYGIMQKAKNIYTLPVEFGWNDLGTWSSLYEKLEKDKQDNAVVNAKTIFNEASGNVVSTSKNKHVVIQGLNDFIVVEKDDVLLICPKKNEQDIKQIVTQVKEQFGKDLV